MFMHRFEFQGRANTKLCSHHPAFAQSILRTVPRIPTYLSHDHSNNILYERSRVFRTTPLLSRLYQSVDLIMFNPPYVPTTSEEHKSASSTIVASWSGGRLGREVIDPFLSQAYNLLSPHGCIYLLLSRDNCPEKVHLMMTKLSNGRLHAKEILHRRVHNEFLTVFRYSC
ncbi:unnamed protein product [Schistosoma rodhaini]|nr:unnamed protein product [Schistosoma rodhaini]